jgi:hypothetical protein
MIAAIGLFAEDSRNKGLVDPETKTFFGKWITNGVWLQPITSATASLLPTWSPRGSQQRCPKHHIFALHRPDFSWSRDCILTCLGSSHWTCSQCRSPTNPGYERQLDTKKLWQHSPHQSEVHRYYRRPPDRCRQL